MILMMLSPRLRVHFALLMLLSIPACSDGPEPESVTIDDVRPFTAFFSEEPPLPDVCGLSSVDCPDGGAQ